MQTTFVSFAALTLLVPVLQSAEINSLSLTPDGTNTDFVLTGVYGANAPATAYSAPGSPYNLSFSLPTSPTSFQGIHDGGKIFALTTSALLNGVNFVTSNATFFDASLGGGLALCLNTICGPTQPVNFINFEVFAQQLYTGVPPHPTFISGDGGLDSSQSYLVYAAPEPSSGLLLLSAAALLALVNIRERRRIFLLTSCTGGPLQDIATKVGVAPR